MRGLRIDFYRKPPAPWTGRVLLCCTLIAAAWVCAEYVRVSQAAADLEHAVARMERRLVRPAQSSATPDTPDASRAIQRAVALSRALATPWDKFFRILESSVDANVALLGAEPDARQGMLRISAEAKDEAAMVAFVDKLRDSSLLADVVLVSHQVQQQIPYKPVRFTLQSAWFEGSGVAGAGASGR